DHTRTSASSLAPENSSSRLLAHCNPERSDRAASPSPPGRGARGEGEFSASVDGEGSNCELQTRPQLSGLVLWGRFLSVAILVAIVCAAQLLPFFELLVRSQRDTGFGFDRWSMPIWGWANFLVPLFRTTPTASGTFFQESQGWTSS